MSNGANTTNSQQVLGRLCREGSQAAGEITIVTSPGDRTAAWAVKVKSNSSYNIYNVMQAVNLGESFTQQGTLPVDTYAVMFRVGDKNVFRAPA